MVESRALRDGLQAALQFGLLRLEIEGDNSIVIDALQKKSAVPWQITKITQDIHTLIQQTENVQLSHIYREAHMVADWLFKFGHSIADTWSTTDWVSFEFRAILHDDRNRRTLVRRGA
uniref:RNase H type-1 domain-containing protein n=1 Tax=Opuntia streptacantha TaxID=393608 RepID=A0A7C8ZIP8_OPUST